MKSLNSNFAGNVIFGELPFTSGASTKWPGASECQKPI